MKRFPRHEHSIMRERAFARRRKSGVMGASELKDLDLEHGWYSRFRQNLLRAAVWPRGGKPIMSRLVWPLRLLSHHPEGVYAERPRWPGAIALAERPPHGTRWRGVRRKGPYRPWRRQPTVGPDAPIAAFSATRNRKGSRRR